MAEALGDAAIEDMQRFYRLLTYNMNLAYDKALDRDDSCFQLILFTSSFTPSFRSSIILWTTMRQKGEEKPVRVS